MRISKDLRAVAKAKRKLLLGKDGVVAVGVGAKCKKGTQTRTGAVLCFVKEKKDISALLKKDLIPATLTDKGITVQTDVIEVGEIKALSSLHRAKHRPIKAGISVGHGKVTAGTLGLIVERNGEAHILSNNHVIANSNNAAKGDAIYQPAVLDSGTISANIVAHLDSFVPISFGAGSVNEVDCALAKIKVSVPVPPPEPTPEEPITPKPDKKSFWDAIIEFFMKFLRIFGIGKKSAREGGQAVASATSVSASSIEYVGDILGIGSTTGVINSNFQVDDYLQKSGRTTGVTEGKILAIDVAANVSYGTDGTATFYDQIVASYMSEGGDSGSIVLDKDKNLVGLLFAGSSTVTILNPIDKVFSKLGITGVKK